nr:MAG TPA: hypothetical protein [Caudoviricetes sp.]
MKTNIVSLVLWAYLYLSGALFLCDRRGYRN